MTDRKKLREAAMRAMDPNCRVGDASTYASFKALCTPETILSLLDDLDRLQVAREVIGDMVRNGFITTSTEFPGYYVGENVLPTIMGHKPAPSPAIGRDDEESVRGEDWENAAHDLLWETGRRDEFEALRERADENARERSQP